MVTMIIVRTIGVLKEIETRSRVQRAILSSVFFANGTPMLLGGDEAGRTQKGNNNAYCQDNEVSWFEWSLMETKAAQSLFGFTARLIALRHTHPILRCRAFLHGREEIAPGIKDIDWFDESAQPLAPESWNDGASRTLVLRRAAKDNDGAVTILTLFLNPTEKDVRFHLPVPPGETRVLADRAAPGRVETGACEAEIEVGWRSAVLTLTRRLGNDGGTI
jgi:isoamylase